MMSNRLLMDPVLRQIVAGSSPDGLWRSRLFWRGQPAVFLTLGVCFCFLLFLFRYSFDLGTFWGVLLALLIWGIGLYGSLSCIKALAKVQVETAIIDEIEARGGEYLARLKAGQAVMVDLDRLEENILPHNPSQTPLAMIRLFQHICKEAKGFHFESSINAMLPAREEALDEVFRLQNLQKLALWAGILGTFIGLLGAIGAAKFQNIQSNEGFIIIIQEMFGNLFSAFRASLGGLEMAMLLSVLLLLLRKKHEIYFLKMEQTVDTILTLARNAINKSDFLMGMEETRNAMRGLSEKVDNQTRELAFVFGGVQQRIDSQTSSIALGIAELAQAGLRLDDFLRQVHKLQNEFVDYTRTVYQDISMKTVGEKLEQGITRAGHHISDAIGPEMSAVSARLAEFNDTASLLRSTVQGQSRDVSVALGGLGQELRELTRTVSLLSEAVNQLNHRPYFRKRRWRDRLAYFLAGGDPRK